MKNPSYGKFTYPRNNRPCGIARLDKNQLRKRLQDDIHQWMKDGHQIDVLPSAPNIPVGQYDSLSDLMTEVGLLHEY